MEPKIIFEDTNLLVLDKPAGLVVHEGAGHNNQTLVDWLKHKFPKSTLAKERYGIVHRLDKDTSGILLVAKTPLALKHLQKLFRDHLITKEYVSLVHGKLTPDKGVINIPLARGLSHRTKFEPARDGRTAETEYAVTKYFPKYTYLKAWPKTGRTHQLRVHFSSIGHPIVGDKTYGKTDSLSRQFLHAHQITFVDWNGKPRHYTSGLPVDLNNFLSGIK